MFQWGHVIGNPLVSSWSVNRSSSAIDNTPCLLDWGTSKSGLLHRRGVRQGACLSLHMFTMGCDQTLFRRVFIALAGSLVVILLYLNATLSGMPNYDVVKPAFKRIGTPNLDTWALLLNNSITKAASTNIREPSGINKMIIYGKYRTGSTFTSEFFFRHEDIAYIFEPLHVRVGEEPVTGGQQILWDMFNCQFNTSSVQRMMKRWLDRSVFCQITNQFPGCIHGQTYPIEKAEKHCKQTHTHVIKVIRIARLSELESFLKQGVKVLHVIRDPRGVVSSRYRVRKQQYANLTYYAASYCNRALADIKYIREQERSNPTLIRQMYHVVRYEDLVADPVEWVKSLYEFMGISPDENVRKWAKSQATPANKTERQEEKVYSTWRRNPKATSTKWRDSIKYSSVLQIQKVCEEFFSVLGYRAVKSEKELRNHSIPVVNFIDTKNLLHAHWKLHRGCCDGDFVIIGHHYTETKMSSFWWKFHHWLHRKLSFWQLSVQPVMKISVAESFVEAQIKENIKVPRHWLLWAESMVTGGFPSQKASNAENVSIWRHHHEHCQT